MKHLVSMIENKFPILFFFPIKLLIIIDGRNGDHQTKEGTMLHISTTVKVFMLSMAPGPSVMKRARISG